MCWCLGIPKVGMLNLVQCHPTAVAKVRDDQPRILPARKTRLLLCATAHNAQCGSRGRRHGDLSMPATSKLPLPSNNAPHHAMKACMPTVVEALRPAGARTSSASWRFPHPDARPSSLPFSARCACPGPVLLRLPPLPVLLPGCGCTGKHQVSINDIIHVKGTGSIIAWHQRQCAQQRCWRLSEVEQTVRIVEYIEKRSLHHYSLG